MPTSVFKAIYDPRRETAGAYPAPNTNDAGSGEASASPWEAVSIARLRELTGIDVFPSLPEAVKTAAPRLPEPHPRRWRPPS